LDALGLLERAEAIGFSPRRASVLREALRHPRLTRQTLMRVEMRVRAWMVRHRPHTR
jgi:hypothetical protein